MCLCCVSLLAVVFVLALFASMACVSGCVVAPQDEEDVPLELRGSAEYAEIMKLKRKKKLEQLSQSRMHHGYKVSQSRMHHGYRVS